ncbi:MAG: ABC transporter ATP-binding protein [Syntrophomonadaceae bacterium]|nr:ABC transporter ATP-binding protein [Syntrophomonadaceae bacterium]
MIEQVPILEVRGIFKKYKRSGIVKTALNGVSIQLRPSEILGVVGESGCGKSTLLRQMSCQERPESGDVLLCGESVIGKSTPDVCQSIQMVFQDALASFDPRMRVSASIDEALKHLTELRGDALTLRREELIRMVGLSPDLAERYPVRLSGGQCQRLAVARALAAQPKVLLCDEVTSALDVSAQAQIVRLLAQLRAELGLSIVFVSHDLALVGSLCDRIVVMRDGYVVEQGAASEVLSSPKSDYTKQLLASVYTTKNSAET